MVNGKCDRVELLEHATLHTKLSVSNSFSGVNKILCLCHKIIIIITHDHLIEDIFLKCMFVDILQI